MSLQKIREEFTNTSLVLKFFSQLRREAKLSDASVFQFVEPEPEMFI